ncbi:PKD domain-containing protein [Pricia antarctica]|uniref:PKD domain-containing protein n=1 Tax=Pricia antarctica TaxID=641691 RepID=A0A1G6YQ42_9FLAO|nr:PKD domain-containing protein [Pricia antarctica]SDD92624.1 PKD domain-containing protein [Pricia antarctica]
MLLFVALAVFYSCTADEDLHLDSLNQNSTEKLNIINKESSGTSSSDSPPSNQTDTTTVSHKPSTDPIAVVSPSSGFSPLEVTLTVGNLVVSKTFTKYEWKFKDGTKVSSAKAVHTFKEVGEHKVELTATDEEGQVVTDSVTVTVLEPENEFPVAVASATTLIGDAPLKVDFTGGNSSDDTGNVDYFWDFQDGSSSNQANPSHTFNDPGVYNIWLTIIDEEGLKDRVSLTISVNQVNIGNIACGTGGGMAGDTGQKVWCWNSVTIPDYSNTKGVGFSNGELKVDSECYEKQVSIEGNRLKFRVNPIGPKVGSWCSEDFNMRAEIRTAPWNVRHTKGTEEWFGWTYTFGNDYSIDRNNQWLFFQVHNGVVGQSPHVELMVVKDGQFNGHSAGEIFVVNNATGGSKYNPTGITPRAGNALDVVVHTIWGDGSNGKFQVWINGQKVHDKQEATVYASHPWAGNAKWGIYKWPWRNESSVRESLEQGLKPLETYMGTLRIITRQPGEPDYGKDSYSEVAPD